MAGKGPKEQGSGPSSGTRGKDPPPRGAGAPDSREPRGKCDGKGRREKLSERVARTADVPRRAVINELVAGALECAEPKVEQPLAIDREGLEVRIEPPGHRQPLKVLRTHVRDREIIPRDGPDKLPDLEPAHVLAEADRKSTRLNSSHGYISYAVFCLK